MKRWITLAILAALAFLPHPAAAQISNPPIQFQSNSTPLGVSFTFNCTTGLTCAITNGVFTIQSAGGGGSVGSGTAGQFTYYSATGTTVIGNPHLDDGATTAATITSTEAIAAPSYSTNGFGAGYFQCTAGTLPGVGAASTIRQTCPATATAYEMVLPTAAGTGLLAFNNSSNVITASYAPIVNFSGGDPTGATDSYTALQAAATALCSSHYELVIPPGTYKTSASVLFPCLPRIRGAGSSLTTITASASGYNTFIVGPGSTTFVGPSGWIRDLSLFGNARTSNSGISALQLSGVIQYIVDSVTLDNDDIGLDLINNNYGVQVSNLRAGFPGDLNVGINLRTGAQSGSDISFINPWVTGVIAGISMSGGGGGYHFHGGQIGGGITTGGAVDTSAGVLMGRDYLSPGTLGEATADFHGTSFEGVNNAHVFRAFNQVHLTLDGVYANPNASGAPAISFYKNSLAQSSNVAMYGTVISGFWGPTLILDAGGFSADSFLELGTYSGANQPTLNGVQQYVASMVVQSAITYATVESYLGVQGPPGSAANPGIQVGGSANGLMFDGGSRLGFVQNGTESTAMVAGIWVTTNGGGYCFSATGSVSAASCSGILSQDGAGKLAIGVASPGAKDGTLGLATLNAGTKITTPILIACSGVPWIDPVCDGADPTGVGDSTTAIQTAFNSACSPDGGTTSDGCEVRFQYGSYKITTLLTASKNSLKITCGGAQGDPGVYASEKQGNCIINVASATAGIDITGAHIRIDGLTLNSASSVLGTDDGFRIRGLEDTVTNTSVNAFGRNCYRFDSAAGVTNANFWTSEHNICTSPKGDGFYYTGVNVNAGYSRLDQVISAGGFGFNNISASNSIWDLPYASNNVSSDFEWAATDDIVNMPYCDTGTSKTFTLVGAGTASFNNITQEGNGGCTPTRLNAANIYNLYQFGVSGSGDSQNVWNHLGFGGEYGIAGQVGMMWTEIASGTAVLCDNTSTGGTDCAGPDYLKITAAGAITDKAGNQLNAGVVGTSNITANVTPSGTQFMAFLGARGQLDAAVVTPGTTMPRAGTVGQLHVRVTTAEGASATLAFTLMDASTGESLTCTIPNSGTTCADTNTAHYFSWASGDELAWQTVQTGTGSSQVIWVSFLTW